jgi:ribonuclease HI
MPMYYTLQVAGAGGVIYNSGGTIVYTYTWGLYIASNNIVEACVLLQGLNQAKILNIPNFIVVGDSKLIVKYLISDFSH